MVDKREAILSRLAVVLEALPGVQQFLRNDTTVNEHKLPAVVLLDSDEENDGSADDRGRPPRGPQIIHMRPEIYLVLAETEAGNLGPMLNLYRRLIKAAVMLDSQLLSLCKDRDIRYEGVNTDLGLGRSISGEMAVNFDFVYFEGVEPVDESEIPTEL